MSELFGVLIAVFTIIFLMATAYGLVTGEWNMDEEEREYECKCGGDVKPRIAEDEIVYICKECGRCTGELDESKN